MKKSLLDIIDENNHSLSLVSDGKTIHEVQVCGDCKGEGSVTTTLYEGHSRGLNVGEQECDECEGSGLVLVSITINVKPFKPKRHENS